LLAILQALRVGEHPTPAGALALGLLLGLVALSRAVFVLFLPFVLLWAIAIWGVRRRTGYAVFAVAAAGMVITLLPWTARNYVVLHAVVPVQSNGAAVFWAGNNARADGGLVWATDRTWTEGPSPDDDYYGWRALGVRGTNARYMQSALTWIRTHPQSYARLLTRKVVRLYEFTRTQDGATLRVPYAIEVVHVAVLGLAFVGLMLTARRWRTLAMLLLLIVFTHGTALLFAGSTRYLLSMLPSVVTFAAVAAIGVAHALSAPKPHRAAVEA
jgi:hypothetical protein